MSGTCTEALEQLGLDIDDGRMSPEAEARLRLYDADFTPRAVARQGLARLFARMRRPPRRILDMCAGAGVWSSEAKNVMRLQSWPTFAHVTAIEIREEERPHLERNADEVIIGDLLLARELEPFDCIVGNPAFPIFVAALPELLRCLVPGGLLLALFHNGLGQRGTVEIDGDAEAELFDRYPPLEQWRIRGPIEFRGKQQINPKTGKPYSADVRDYSHFVWSDYSLNLRRGMCAASASWLACDLPRLPSAARAWKARPGTEDVDGGGE